MNQRELARIAGTRAGIRLEPDTYIFADCLFAGIVEGLKRDGEVFISCVGRISVVRRPARRQFNVHKQKMLLPEQDRLHIRFKPSENLRAYLKGKIDHIRTRSPVVNAIVNKKRST